MKSETPNPSFADLEKQLAKDTLELALQNLHKEIIRDIEKNKKTFSEEIQRTLKDFKEDLKESVSEEMDKKLSSLFEKHFKDTSLQVKESFKEIFNPVLKTTQDDMNHLKSQGDSTLRSWKEMMLQYTGLWTKPFILVFLASAFTGMLVFFVSAYFLWAIFSETIKGYEKRLVSNEEMLLWYFSKYKESPEYIEKKTLPNSQPHNQAQNKKKK